MTAMSTAEAGSPLVPDETAEPAPEEQEVLARTERLIAEHDPKATAAGEFWGHQFDAGLAWVQFPPGCGGLGLAPKLQVVIDRRLREAGAPPGGSRNPLGYGMAAPTIVAHGSDEMKQKYLRPLFTCEEIWCQLFSEPGAGSDLASLAARAVRDGDEWVVDGQKVWTTLAHVARRALLVARSDPSAEKHRGLTYFVLDMDQPGVEVRPIRQITGDAEFNEVFLSRARIPDGDRLGAVGDGWRVSITTLMNERVSIGSTLGERGQGPIGIAIALWRKRTEHDPVMRDRLTSLFVEAEVQRLTNLRATVNRARGTPGPEGSTAKLAYAELNQRIYDLCIDLMGPAGMLYPSYEMRRPDSVGQDRYTDPSRMFLRARANSIEGGTSEIMRNILGERVLGLPGDVRVDKGVPWSDLPRS